MKRFNYISLMMLLLFVVASLCRLSAVFSCSCTEHHHSEEHICCGCSEHVQDCSNHDQVFSAERCRAILPLEGDIINYSELKTTYGAPITHLLGGATYNQITLSPLDDVTLLQGDGYCFSSSECYLLTRSLRAPPMSV